MDSGSETNSGWTGFLSYVLVLVKRPRHVFSKVMRAIRGNRNVLDSVVWWHYGQIFRHKSTGIICVNVLLREKNDLSKYSKIEHPIEALGVSDIGSVCRIEMEPAEFDVNFDDDGWCFAAASLFLEEFGLYKAYGVPGDPSYLLSFKTSNGMRLLIPCIEFYTRMYGQEADLRLKLLTLPTIDLIDPRSDSSLLHPLVADEEDNVWKICTRRRYPHLDTVLIAFMKYSSETRSVIAELHHEALKHVNNPEKYSSGLKVRPWFKGRATLRVSGFKSDDGASFLGLCIDAATLPSGPQILATYPSSCAPGYEQGADEGALVKTVPTAKPADVITERLDTVPCHGTQNIVVVDRSFSVLGAQPPITWVANERDALTARRVPVGQTSTVATGPRSGGGGDTGRAIHKAPIFNIYQSVLVDVWASALALKIKYPRRVTMVEFLTNLGWSDQNLTLIEMPEVDHEKKRPKWCFIGRGKDVYARRALVVRMEIDKRLVYLLDYERPIKSVPSGKGNNRIDKEEYGGAVLFVMQKTTDDKAEIARALKALVDGKGNLLFACAHIADVSVKMIHKRGESGLFMGTIMSSLAHMGIDL